MKFFNSYSKALRFAADGKVLFSLTGHSGPVTSVAFSADGKTLASSGSDRTAASNRGRCSRMRRRKAGSV